MMYVLYIFLLVPGFLEKSIRFPYTAVGDLNFEDVLLYFTLAIVSEI